MKKLMFLFLFVFLFSCEKEPAPAPELCWTCKSDIYIGYGVISHIEEVCGMTHSEMVKYVDANTWVSGDTTSTMFCRIK